MSADYRRTLPHWQPADSTFFVTWRLHGSRPKCPGGPLWLKDPSVAETVVVEILASKLRGDIAELFAWVVMPNHVHLLLKPKEDLMPVLQRIKGTSARNANLQLHRKGRFWLAESFDHWIRNDWEFRRIQSYIEHNPVAAGLVDCPAAWRWSSAAGAGLSPQPPNLIIKTLE